MRFLGLDIGTVRIGAALSDDSGTIASPLATISATQPETAIQAEVQRICEEHEVEMLVVGLPLSMGGQGGGRSARKSKKLGRSLGEALGLPVAFADERFTTVQAVRVLIDANVDRKKRKTVVDKVAAAVMLQAFLDKRTDNG
jgi:putative Holliday junction resolvase